MLPPEMTQAVHDACDSIRQVDIAFPSVLSVCIESRCAKGALQEPPTEDAELESRLTASKPDIDCLTSAMHSRDGEPNEAVVSATITERGEINYFKVISGSAQLTPQLLRKLSKCQSTPALLDSKPIRHAHVMRFMVE